jgi:hypothetical protein
MQLSRRGREASAPPDLEKRFEIGHDVHLHLANSAAWGFLICAYLSVKQKTAA